MAEKRFRVPKLSARPEPGKGVYRASYRDEDGKIKHKRFTADRAESQRLYLQWATEKYGVQRPEPPSAETATTAPTLDRIVSGYLQHKKGLVKDYDKGVGKGHITPRAHDDIRTQALDILRWCKLRFGADRLAETPLADLMTANQYEAMMAGFSNGGWHPDRKHGLGPSQMNKRRQRFWDMVKWARNEGLHLSLSFGPETARKFGGNDVPRDRKLPTVKELKKLLETADDTMQLWIWLAIGVGFGNQDIAEVCPKHFDQTSYDMSRTKTQNQHPRNGTTPALVWAMLKHYLDANPRQPDELLFATRTGRPVAWIEAKTSKEIEAATARRGKRPLSYKRSDSIQQAFFKLQKKAGVKLRGGFYSLRVLAATAFASQPGVTLAYVKAFLGHGKSEAADRYMQPLTPENRPLVDWVNRVLSSPDITAWRT